MKNIIYKIIYTPSINKILRNILRLINFVFVSNLKIPISGKFSFSIDNTKIIIATNESCSVTQELYWKGYLEYEFTRLFIELVKHSSCFYDIGANIGYFGMLGSKLNSDCTIICFEPSKGPLHFLRLNKSLNECYNLDIKDIALSDKIGTIEFHNVLNTKYNYLEHHLSGSHSFQNLYGKQKNLTYFVETNTLDNFVFSANEPPPDFIKLDTESTEHFILSNGIQTLTTFRPIIICEIYNEISKDIDKIIQNLNDYIMFRWKNNVLNPVENSYSVSENDFRNFLIIPKEKINLIENFIRKR